MTQLLRTRHLYKKECLFCALYVSTWKSFGTLTGLSRTFVIASSKLSILSIQLGLYTSSYFAQRNPVLPFGKKIIAHRPISKDFFYSSVNQISFLTFLAK